MEFSNNRELMELVSRYYDLILEWDEIVTRCSQLEDIKDEKAKILRELT